MTSTPTLKPKNEIDIILTWIAQNNLSEALTLVDGLLKREPANAAAWHAKGGIFLKQGDKALAISCFVQAVNHKADFRDACFDLARTLQDTGKTQLAIKAYEHLLKMDLMVSVKKPADPDAGAIKKAEEWYRKGEAFQQRCEWGQAESAFRKVLTFWPDMPEALVSLGIILFHMRRYAEAERLLLHCLRIRPGFASALNTLGSAYAETGQPFRAIAAWQQAIAADPEFVPGILNIAKALSSRDRYDESIKAYEQALALDPKNTDILLPLFHLLHILCRWDRAEEIRARTQKALLTTRQWTDVFFVTVHFPELQLANAKRYAANFFPAGSRYDAKRPLPADARKDGRLRIGYLSGDYHKHATAYLISEMFERHDRERFEIYAYSHGPEDNSPERQRIVRGVEQFRDIRLMDDPSASEMIKQDGIDIMVDLKGYTTGSRLGLMALRPAPIQMHYLGFPGTIGAPFIDYYIADSVAAPEAENKAFSECLIRLPHSYQINDRTRPLPLNVPPREAYGLPPEGLVICDFNNSYKITRDLFSVWMRVLQAIDGSVLWIYESYPEATHNIRQFAASMGIDPARIIPARSAPFAEHLSRYRHADLFLDTFPYCGHTTGSDALWCAVPVVTMAGESFVSRVGASLLHAVGLPELVTSNLEEYEALALSLARDKDRRAQIRKHLEDGRMGFPLFDSIATTRAIEAAYLHAAELHRDKKPPQAFAV